MTCPCRCTRKVCQARQSKARRPEHYLRPPKCKACGKGTLRVDTYRQTKEMRNKKVTCYPDRSGCSGYSFPHRIGSKWCDHNPNLTIEQLQEREAYA